MHRVFRRKSSPDLRFNRPSAHRHLSNHMRNDMWLPVSQETSALRFFWL